MANTAARMIVDGVRDGEVADDPAGEQRRIMGRETRTSEPELGFAEIGDREECYHDLRAHDQVPRRAPETKDSAESQLSDHGRWKWKGLELDREANRVADDQLALRRQAEGRDDKGSYGAGGITPAMRRIEAELEHGTLVPDTDRFALKSPDRFKEKLAKLFERYPDQPSSKLASAIHDGIRYTFIFPTGDYAAGVVDAIQRLRDDGYDLRLIKPSWGAEDYRGINSRWCDTKNKVLFEVQFHTPESWDAKQRTHDIYEKLCDVGTSPVEREKLEEEQQMIVAAIPIPPGVENISYYAKGQPDNRE